MGNISTAFQKERALLIGLELSGVKNRWSASDSLDELERLAETAGVEVVGRQIQKRPNPHPSTLVGRGKAQDLHVIVQDMGADLIITDEDLAPTQQKNLEEITGVKIIDRTQLILDIFAQRARTREGKLQVELAQLKYLLPRLTRRWTHLSRQTAGAGVGLRGPGETQLEVDRRRIRQRIAHLEDQVSDVKKRRKTQRRLRKSTEMPHVAIVGYTNAGKSTLLNALSHADIPADDKLFMTLDPTVRRVDLGSGVVALMIDTVGFIRKLPHGLVESFKATLEEVLEADVLLHVRDAQSAKDREIDNAVRSVLSEIGADDTPTVTAYNKIDLLDDMDDSQAASMAIPLGGIRISAHAGTGLDKLRTTLREALSARVKTCSVRIPVSDPEPLSRICRVARVSNTTESDDWLEVTFTIDSRDIHSISDIVERHAL